MMAEPARAPAQFGCDEPPDVSTPASMPWFSLPLELEAREPIEATGQQRDAVRLEVASATRGISHTKFSFLDTFLAAGDLLVANDSATLPAALDGAIGDRSVRLHISTPIPASRKRLVEVREPDGPVSHPLTLRQHEVEVDLPDGGIAKLERPIASVADTSRLWEAHLELPLPLVRYLHRWGQPIRYRYVSEPWPLSCYQTIFAAPPGSSEMPSAGRPFSQELMKKLATKGVELCTITLHTGVASLEYDEPPYAEPYIVGQASADLINSARLSGRKIVAVGTTVVRCLETIANDDGLVQAGHGFTDLIITPSTDVRVVDGIITGWHEPTATHLMMLEAIAGKDLIVDSYREALSHGYKWHEFGDSHLILP